MGQTLEKEKPTKKKQKSTLSTLFGASFCSDKRDGFGCFESDSMRVNKLKSSWKKHVLRQLSELGTQEWVQLLIKCLREHNTEESDIIFQNELLRSDFYCVNDTLHYTSESPLYSRTEYPNDSNLENPDSQRDSSRRPLGNKRATIFNIQGNRKDSQSVKNLLESSDIIDEKFFHLNGKDDWLDRSFEITSKEDLHTGPQSGNIMTNQRIINKNADQFKALDEQNINPPPAKKGKKTHIKHAFSNPSSPNLGPKKVDHHHSDDEGGEIDGKVVSHMTLKNRKAKEMGISPLSLPKSAVDSNKNQDSPKEGNPYKTLLPYKIITNLLTQHLRTEHHILCMMIQTFEEYFGRTYREIPNDVKNEKILLGQVKDFALKATSELKQFIEIMHQAISLFYRLDQLKIGQKLGQEALFTSDNMFNFVSSNVFDGEIHDIIFNLYQKLNLSVEGTYESSLNRYKSPNPKDFGVDDDFCLNERTVQLLRDKNLLPTYARERDELFQTLYFDIASPKNREERSQELKEQDQTKNPYRKAILTLQALSEKKSPIHKLKVIVKLVENISACIEHFYKDLGVSEIKKIDSEQTLAIFMYITAQSGVQDITTHCRIIENFSTRNLLESLSGYYATLLEDAVNKICGMDVESQCSEANSQISEVHNTFT